MPLGEVDVRAAARRVGRIALSFLVVGALIALGAAPFWVVVLFTDVARTWPLLAVSALALAPALAATFVVYRTEASTRVARLGALEEPRRVAALWWQGWRRHAGTAALIGLVALLIAAVAIVNIGVFLGSPAGNFAIPLNALVAALAIITALHLLVLLTEPGIGVPWPTRIKAALALPVRRLPLTAGGVLALLVAGSVIIELAPVGVLATLPPLLWLAWLAFRATLRPVLPESDA